MIPKWRVLICDDSPSARLILSDILSRDGRFEVVGEARDGAEACELCRRLAPDVVAMDIHMPRMSGLEATSAIMAGFPTPVVIVSARAAFAAEAARAGGFDAGAFAVVEKPRAPGLPNHASAAREVADTLAAMAGVKAYALARPPDAGRRGGRDPDAAPVEVLVCDDSPTARAALAALLSASPGIRVVGEARDGAEAVELARSLRPDVVTMDIEMPAMHGYDATRRIVAERRAAVLIVSASAGALTAAGVRRGEQSGACAVIPRPRGVAGPQARELLAAVHRSARRRIPAIAPEPLDNPGILT